MPRVFVGIEIPMPVRQRLALLRGNLPDARWVDPDDYHLTLRFLGECDGPTLNSVMMNLDRITAPKLTLQFTEPGSFGHGKVRAIWMGVAESAELRGLRQMVETAVRGAGVPPDSRKFTPHVTLARVRGGKPAAVAETLAAIGNPMIEPFIVKRFVLYSSGRSRGGGPYAVEEVFPFAEDTEDAR